MKIKELNRHISRLNESIQLAEFDIIISDPNGYSYKIHDIVVDESTNSFVIAIDEGSCD